ncbi:SHOCT domain-containing protein [Arthrobacter sp. R-11]|uniref:SHOCT domain-containing protein n=1 Tax=Arthrobacter sp. R-11 TaxID=3404053 RepID=UPI003CF94087
MEAPQKPWGPFWPFVLGIGIFIAGIVCGFKVPVGAYCDGAFLPDQESARKADLDRAYDNAMKLDLHLGYSTLPETDYESACKASAAQWSALWWAVIALGVVVFFLGFVLWNRARRIAATPAAAPDAPAAPAQGVAAELAHLAQLRDQGVVTQDEFERQKAKLLNG